MAQLAVAMDWNVLLASLHSGMVSSGSTTAYTMVLNRK
jgi:hypothetical protein